MTSNSPSGLEESLLVSRLDELTANAGRHFGGKAANLGELISTGQRVPGGIALSREALAYFLRSGGIDLRSVERIHTLSMTFLESALTAAVDLQKQILHVIRTNPMPEDLVSCIERKAKPWLGRRLAIRSSCVVEDSRLTSFAGQYQTILNVTGNDDMLAAIRDCWASQYDGRALNYAITRRGMPVLSPAMAVVIQEMVEADFAGVCFSIGPTPSTAELSVVEAVVGCGEQLVSGATTPYHYEVATDGTIRSKTTPNSSVPGPDDRTVQSIAAKTRTIALHFGCPQDVEWAIVQNEIVLLQARPITSSAKSRRGELAGALNFTSAPAKTTNDPLISLRDDLHEWMLTTCDPSAFRAASYILANQQKDGSWRVEGHPEWDEVTTAMVAHLLIDGGIPASLRWKHPNAPNTDPELGIPAAIQFIGAKASLDGRWGSDLWDTCQVIRALHRCGVPRNEPLLARPIRFIQSEIGHNLETSKQQEWFGAGFLAVALRMFNELEMPDETRTCLALLLDCQNTDGEFYGPNAEAHGNNVPSEWHTAEAISALALTQHACPRLKKACDWLITKQQSNGSWGVSYEPYCLYNTFFTSYSVMALLHANVTGDSVHRAFKWLRGMQKVSGGFGDFGSSLMAASAIQAHHKNAFTMQLPIPIFTRIQASLGNSTN